MITTLIVILLIVWLASLAGPRYYPAYSSRRYRRYPLWGGRSNVLLVVLALFIILWLLGVIRVGGFPSPLKLMILPPLF